MKLPGSIASSKRDKPNAPTAASATNVGTGRAYNNGRIDVTFTAPAYDGGEAITGYIVTSTPSSITATGTASPISVTGLASGTSYTFTVSAINSVGTGTPSSATTAVTATTIPQAPTIGTATGANATASVTFTAGATGGAAVSTFTATSTPSSITGSAASSPITVSGLTNGTGYTFTVAATNTNGTSLASAASNSTIPATVPVAPTIGTLSPTANVAYGSTPTMSIAFTANGDGGAAITSYKYSTNGGANYLTASGTTSPLTLPTQSTGSVFVAGTSYSVLLKAVNVKGDSSASSASNSSTACTVPDVSQSVSVAWTVGGTTATISFTAGNSGGSPITSYDFTGFPIGFQVTGTSSPITHTTGTPWPSNQVFRLYAYNACGFGSSGDYS
jgi:hypothetical protein